MAVASAGIVATLSPVSQFQIIKLPSNAQVATYDLDKLIHLTALTCPLNSFNNSPVSIFQMKDDRIYVEAAIIFSSNKKSTQLKELPFNVRIHSPVSIFQIRTVLSADPVTKIFSFNLAAAIRSL